MEEIKNTEVVEEQGEGYEYDEGVEPTSEEIAAAEALVAEEEEQWQYIMYMVDIIRSYREQVVI